MNLCSVSVPCWLCHVKYSHSHILSRGPMGLINIHQMNFSGSSKSSRYFGVLLYKKKKKNEYGHATYFIFFTYYIVGK